MLIDHSGRASPPSGSEPRLRRTVASMTREPAMDELKTRLEKLLADAEDCELISRLAEDVTKRATFRRLAAQFRKMADEVKAEIAKNDGAKA